MGSIRFAHISDLHLSDPGSPALSALLSKRALGFLSWRRRRRQEHRPEILERLLHELEARPEETLVVTGDLTQIGLPGEFLAARSFLERLGPPERVLLVPGNHDSYGRTRQSETYAHWRPYLGGLKTEGSGPRLDRREGVLFIGLDSALPTAPLLATGRLGRAQLAALDRLLAEHEGDPGFRVLYLHHPPDPRAISWRKRLVDGDALLEILGRRGVDLVLHGHDHRPRSGTISSAGRAIPVLGIASASALGLGGVERRAALHRFSVRREGGDWLVELERRRHDPTSGSFERLESEILRIPVRAAQRRMT